MLVNNAGIAFEQDSTEPFAVQVESFKTALNIAQPNLCTLHCCILSQLYHLVGFLQESIQTFVPEGLYGLMTVYLLKAEA